MRECRRDNDRRDQVHKTGRTPGPHQVEDSTGDANMEIWEEPSSFQPICLLDVLGKVFETIIKERLEISLQQAENDYPHMITVFKRANQLRPP